MLSSPSFYNGAPLEKDILNKAYMRLVRHVNSIFKVRSAFPRCPSGTLLTHAIHFQIRIGYSMIEDFVIKYAWSAVSKSEIDWLPAFSTDDGSLSFVHKQAGYLLISIPVFFGDVLPPSVTGSSKTPSAPGDETKVQTEKVAKRTQNYISNRRLLLALADAGGRLMSSYKDMAELAGYTSRVYTLLSTLHELDIGRYQETIKPADWPADKPFYDLGHINGVVIEGVDSVEFDNVPIVAPAPGLPRGGEELVKSLGVSVKPGEHLLITGPNVRLGFAVVCFRTADSSFADTGHRQDQFCKSTS